MTDMRIFFKVMAIMAIVSISAVLITTSSLYFDDLRRHERILVQTAGRYAKGIGAFFKHYELHAALLHSEEIEKDPSYVIEETTVLVKRILEAMEGMNVQRLTPADIEIAVASLIDDNIVFQSHRYQDPQKPTIIKKGSKLAVPMQLALKGKSGKIRSIDYDGKKVLSAYTYQKDLKIGIVAKSRTNLISGQFVKGAIFAGLPALIIVFLGVWLVHKITNPVIDQLRKDNAKYKKMVSERAEAIRSLEENEHRLQCFFDAAFEGIAITKDRIFVDSNKRFAEMFGYEIEEMVGMPVSSLVHQDDMNLVKQNIINEHTEPYEHRAIKKDGSIVFAEVHGQQTMYQGEPARITTIHDLTAHKKALEKIEQLYKRQQHASKMEAIGNFAAGIAHDFNNSLTPIVGNCDLLLLTIDREEDPDLQECRDKVLKIITAAETAALLVSRIQSFTHKENGVEVLMPLKLDVCILEAFDFLRSMTPTSIDMELNIDENLGLISTTDVMIRQILMNLVKNSAHAMDNEGKIYIDVNNEKLHVERFGLKPGKYIRINVEDNGCGMPEEVLERAIDPYFTTKEDRSGTGLGLAVVNGILESHGGLIHLQSTEGVGTTASIYLPTLEGEAPQVDFCTIDEPLPQGHGERILFVDDEKGIVDMAQPLLTKLNYNVVAFTDSKEAFKAFCVNPTAFDVLMSDMTMPDMSGISLIQRVKEINPEIKVVLSSGFGSDGRFKADLFSDVINTYIQKPVTIRQYAEVLADLCKKD